MSQAVIAAFGYFARSIRLSATLSVCCEVLYRGELPADGRPIRLRSDEGLLGLDNLGRLLLERTDGGRTLRELAIGSGALEVDALLALADLRRRGLIQLPGA